MLYDGQGRFDGSTAATVDYVVRQSGDTVANLRTFTGFLETAKAAGVGPVTLSAEVKVRIDDVVRKVGAAADVLAARTSSNAAKIRAALDTVYVTQASICSRVASKKISKDLLVIISFFIFLSNNQSVHACSIAEGRF